MQLYKMELDKILKSKFTATTGGILSIAIIFFLIRESFIREKISMTFDTAAGFRRLLDLSDIFFCGISVWLITIFAPFYCEDRQYRVDTLLSATKNGKRTIFFRRLQVTCTVTASVFLMASFLTFAFCNLLYGYPVSDVTVKDIEFYSGMAAPLLAEQTIIFFLIRYYINAAIAFIMLDALIICVSVNSKKTPYSFAVLLGIYFLPAFLENMFKHHVNSIGYIVISNQPILLMLSRCLTESWPIYGTHLWVAPFVSVCLIWFGMRKWESMLNK